MISERMLRKWRKEGLTELSSPMVKHPTQERNKYWELHRRILQLTQELLDQHLMKKEK